MNPDPSENPAPDVPEVPPPTAARPVPRPAANLPSTASRAAVTAAGTTSDARTAPGPGGTPPDTSEPPPTPTAQPEPAAVPGPGAVSGDVDVPPAGSTARTMGLLCHLLAFAGFPLPLIGNIAGPLVLWLVKRDEMPFVASEGRKSINFQAAYSVAALVLLALGKLSSSVPLVGWIPSIGAFGLLAGLTVVNIVFVVLAVVRLNEGKPSSYPALYDFLALVERRG